MCVSTGEKGEIWPSLVEKAVDVSPQSRNRGGNSHLHIST